EVLLDVIELAAEPDHRVRRAVDRRLEVLLNVRVGDRRAKRAGARGIGVLDGQREQAAVPYRLYADAAAKHFGGVVDSHRPGRRPFQAEKVLVGRQVEVAHYSDQDALRRHDAILGLVVFLTVKPVAGCQRHIVTLVAEGTGHGGVKLEQSGRIVDL